MVLKKMETRKVPHHPLRNTVVTRADFATILGMTDRPVETVSCVAKSASLRGNAIGEVHLLMARATLNCCVLRVTPRPEPVERQPMGAFRYSNTRSHRTPNRQNS